MSVGRYLIGWLITAVLAGGAGTFAVSVRARLLPHWRGAPARLVEAVVGLSAVEIVLQLLGLVGLLRRPGLGVAGLVLLGAGLLLRRRPGPAASADEPLPRWQLWVAVVFTALVLGLWLGQIAWTYRFGVYDYDSLDYHLPVAVKWFQDGRLGGLATTTPDLAVPSYPFGSELFHAAGMVAFGRDILTPLLNLGWLVLLLLAGWVAGMGRRVPGITLAATATVAGLPQIAHLEAGAALSDVPALAALLSALALLLLQYDPETNGGKPWEGDWPVVLVAGLAAGLAVGAKLTVAPTVLILTIGLTVLGLRRLILWLAAITAVTGMWFVRNLVLAGSPAPSLKLPLFPRPEYALFDMWQQSVASYLGDKPVVDRFFTPALGQLWGRTWPLVAVLVVAGALLALAAGRTWAVRGLGALTFLSVIGYLITPHAAGGPQGFPLLFGGNLRFALPALTIGLVALVLGVERWRWGPPVVVGVLTVPLVEGALAHWDVPGLPYPRHVATGIGLLAAALVTFAAYSAYRRQKPVPRTRPAASWLVGLPVLVVVGVLVAGLPLSSFYLRHRYTDTSSGLNTAYASFQSRTGVRVGVVGIAAKYPYTGRDLSNRAEYIGRRTPHGGFTEVTTCREWRSLLAAGRYGWVVVSPSPLFPSQPAALAWTEDDPVAHRVLSSGGVSVFRLDGPPDPGGCRG